MENNYSYVTKPDVKFDHLEKMDINQMVSECNDKWFNQTLTEVNKVWCGLAWWRANIIGINKNGQMAWVQAIEKSV
jgi:hypothetical protein